MHHAPCSTSLSDQRTNAGRRHVNYGHEASGKPSHCLSPAKERRATVRVRKKRREVDENDADYAASSSSVRIRKALKNAN
mmetsp:Transcript_44521/g.135711  ORF Transcript_44521/g.135711 Transcript_44521/m.135711 type:complete len:80 (-) Transcript_44521:367-606(-)